MRDRSYGRERPRRTALEGWPVRAGSAGSVIHDRRRTQDSGAQRLHIVLHPQSRTMRAPADQAQTVQLDQHLWQMLVDVNEKVNREVTNEDDKTHFGRAEYWTIATDGYGDCEDFALTKRKQLIDAGLPEKALRVAIVKTWRGELHAVLTVATDHGDYVLDSR